MVSWFQRFLLPGFVFQSLIIAGGYGTGRELVEFFLQYGPVGGLLGMLLPTTLLMSLICVIAFELARLTKSYDYRSFLRQLLGRFWVLYEIGYLAAVLLILAVIGAAAGAILTETFGVQGSAGTIILLIAIALLVFKGTAVIEGFLSLWSFVLYGVYLTVFVLSMIRFGPAIQSSLASTPAGDGWLLSGFRYGALQLALIPAMLFATTHIRERKEAIIAGALAGPIAIFPGILFFVAMLGHYPAILERPVPANYVLELLDSRVLQVVFQVVLIGTFVETGTGLIHAFNERIANTFSALNRSMPNFTRPLIAVALLVTALLLSRFGLITLIARGYGALSWVFIGVLIVPLLTVGLWKITR
jgi:uncharacterized membrane protein YkvI